MSRRQPRPRSAARRPDRSARIRTPAVPATAQVSNRWRAQCEALAIYLKLALWPAPLAFEYGRIDPGGARLIAGAAGVATLLAATLWALRRRPVAGFFGASFFLILAPT